MLNRSSSMSRCLGQVILVCVVACSGMPLHAELDGARPRGLREEIFHAVEEGTQLEFGPVGGTRGIRFVSNDEPMDREVRPMTFLVRESLIRVLKPDVWEEVDVEEANALISALVRFARMNDVSPQVLLSLWSQCDEDLLRQLLDHIAILQMEEVLIAMPIEGCPLGGRRSVYVHKPIAPAKHKVWRWRK